MLKRIRQIARPLRLRAALHLAFNVREQIGYDGGPPRHRISLIALLLEEI